MTEIVFKSEMTVELVDSMGSDASVVRAARVSTKGAASRGEQADRGLINYLVRERHSSPIEHVSFQFLVEAPIFIARQMMRHRMASWNEESGRYSKLKPVFYLPERERALTQKGKPGHYVYEQGSDEQYELVRESMIDSARDSWARYDAKLNAGIAREVARMDLPLHIYTSFMLTINARSAFNFLSLRVEDESAVFPSHPQHEIELVALAMEGHVKHKIPITYEAFIEHGRVAP